MLAMSESVGVFGRLFVQRVDLEEWLKSLTQCFF